MINKKKHRMKEVKAKKNVPTANAMQQEEREESGNYKFEASK